MPIPRPPLDVLVTCRVDVHGVGVCRIRSRHVIRHEIIDQIVESYGMPSITNLNGLELPNFKKLIIMET